MQTLAPGFIAVMSVALLAQKTAPPLPGVDPLALQVALDRAGYSPGALDGTWGRNTERALEAHQRDRGGPPALAGDPLVDYQITEADAAGPFVDRIPADLMQQAELPVLSYTSIVELIAERFHAAPALLRRLNPQAAFAAGETVRVPNVEAFVLPAPRIDPDPKAARTAPDPSTGEEPLAPSKPDVTVTVSASGVLTAVDGAGATVFFAPVTTGSDQDPLPIGEWTINALQFLPEFRYNPELFWDADPAHTKAKIPPGPNNPVGVVWIDLSKEHYGIHGTPEPERIGRSASHGCVRLTNWDALRLAGLVKPGTKVVFTP